MSGACNLPEDVLCGCCAGLTQQTPQANHQPARALRSELPGRRLLHVPEQHAGGTL